MESAPPAYPKKEKDMKTKSRNLLTVILALLCALAVGLGVSFALPKTEKITAQASGLASDIKILSSSVREYYLNAAGGSSSVGKAAMTSSISDFNPSLNKVVTQTGITVTQQDKESTAKCIYYDFQVSVTVPAWEEWKISYELEFKIKVDCGSGAQRSAGAYYFKPDANFFTNPVVSNNLQFNKLTNPAESSDGVTLLCKGIQSGGTELNFSDTIYSEDPNDGSSIVKLANKSDVSKTFTFDYGMSVFTGNASTQGNKITMFSVELKNRTQQSTELWISAPEDLTYNYDGTDKKAQIASDITASDWYTRNNDGSYTPGSWASYTLPSGDIKNVVKKSGRVDGYNVTYTLDNINEHGFKLSDGTFTTDPQTFKIIINPVKPTLAVLANKAGKSLYTSNKLSDVTLDFDPLATNPKGTIAWTYPSTSLLQEKNKYQYTFTSQDDNYLDTTGEIELTAAAVVISGIKVTYNQGSNKIFPSITLTDGTSLPGATLGALSVTTIGSDGKDLGTAPLDQCRLSVTSGTTLTGGSTGSITVEYGGFSKDITVNVSVPQLEKITASQKPSTTVKESTTMAQLAQMLEVKAYYEDDPATGKILAFTDYTVTGTLTVSSGCPVNVEVVDAGDNAKANWQNANSGKCSTSVVVEAAVLTGLTANWTGGVEPSPVYDRTPLDNLKPYLTVEAEYDDGIKKTLTDAEYTLTGNLSKVANGGSAVLTAEYGGKSAPVQLNNITKAQLTSVKVTYFDNTQKVKDTDDPDIISTNGMVIVTATYAEFPSDPIIVTSDCTFTGNLVASATNKSIIHVFFDSNEVDYDTYIDKGGLGVWVEAGNVTLLNKPTAANTTFTYNGENQNLLIANLDNAYMTVVGSLQQTAVGKYTVTISLNDPSNYRWDDRSKADVVIEWEIEQLVLNPQVNDKVYSGSEFALKDILDLTDAQWSFITASGDLKNTDVGSYSAKLTIKPEYFGNVVWSTSSVKPTKKPVRLALTTVSASADCEIAWNITQATITATWDDSKKVPTLKLNSATVAKVPSELIVYTFTDVESGKTVSSNKLEKGHDYQITAALNGSDPRANNYVFVAPQPYELSIAAAQPGFGEKVANFMTQTAAGLPIWAWLLIALALLILLIVIIVVCVKRRKTKEEKEEIRARKQEEKERREEERRLQQERLEEERRLQREKLEAERELARAKQEAELEKIRAQAQAGMAGAGMATMAMAQPQQQAMPTQVPVQTVDNDFLKEMRQQMAELRADNKATQEKLAALQNQQAMPTQMPMQQHMMPMQYQQYSGYPQYGDPTLARLEAQINAMQIEQRARYDAEQRIELAAMRAEQHVDRDSRHSVDLAAMREHFNGKIGYNNIPDYSQPNSVEALGAIVAAALKNMANGEVAATQVPELPQKSEQNTPVAANYPSDAVITTTTTVDTTKNKPIRREDNSDFDIDGFYDSIEE